LGVQTPPAHHSVAEHPLSSAQGAPQFPSVVWQTLPPSQSGSPLHLPQAPLAKHNGASRLVQACESPEPRSPLQAAQPCVVVSHDGVAPVHASVVLAEHCAQLPSGRHAGLLAVGHGKVAPESWSPLHAVHELVKKSHAGVVAPQSLHPPHCPLLHTGAVLGQACDVPPPKSPSQAPQAPFTHSGKAPPQSAGLVHGKQAMLVAP
jgi:hypothetical protein